MLKTLFRRIAVALGIAVTAAVPASAAAPAPAARPALWEVSDSDTKIYLFGTIHLLPEHYEWRTPRFDKAVNNAQELVIETDVNLDHPEAFAASFARAALSPTPLAPILDRVPAAKREALAAALAKIGLKPEQLAPMKTWVVGFQLMTAQLAEFGFQGQEGPETVLRREFVAAHKQIGQLETIDQQLGFFDSMSESAQRAFLIDVLDNPEEAKKELNSTLAAWERGDVQTLAKEFKQQVAGSPEFRKALFDRRNPTWAKWIERRLDQPGTILIAVGADHLAAQGGVLDLLRRDGYRVERVQ